MAFNPVVKIPDTSSKICFRDSDWKEELPSNVRTLPTNESLIVYLILRNESVPIDRACRDTGRWFNGLPSGEVSLRVGISGIDMTVELIILLL